MRLRKPKPIPLITTTLAVLLLLSLGGWQLQRLAWKEGLIAALEEANASAPLASLPARDALRSKEFYAVRLRGEYVADKEFHIAGRYRHSKLGYLVLSPFTLEDGRIVLINRGWVPTDHKEPQTRPEDLSGVRELVAQIRLGDDRNAFSPDNRPEINIWFGRDAAAMGESAGLAVEPLTLDLVGEATAPAPIPTGGQIALRNDHLGYAITWFLLAATIVGIFILYHRIPHHTA